MHNIHNWTKKEKRQNMRSSAAKNRLFYAILRRLVWRLLFQNSLSALKIYSLRNVYYTSALAVNFGTGIYI